MSNFAIGFLYYLRERNIDMNLDNPKAFAIECEKYFKLYCKKYPNGLTNLGKLIKFKD